MDLRDKHNFTPYKGHGSHFPKRISTVVSMGGVALAGKLSVACYVL